MLQHYKSFAVFILEMYLYDQTCFTSFKFLKYYSVCAEGALRICFGLNAIVFFSDGVEYFSRPEVNEHNKL